MKLKAKNFNYGTKCNAVHSFGTFFFSSSFKFVCMQCVFGFGAVRLFVQSYVVEPIHADT